MMRAVVRQPAARRAAVRSMRALAVRETGQAGWTLIEMVIVTTIFGLMMAMGDRKSVV